MAATAAHPDHVVFTADDTLVWYSPEGTCEYGFCSRCGSSLFWRTTAIPDKLCITVGSLDQPTGLITTKAWWVAEAGDYHVRAAGVAEFPYED